MNTPLAPAAMAAPAARYAHAVLVTDARRILHTSGVVPIDVDGSTPDDLGEQASLVWRNIAHLLAEAEMGMSDIVSITTYVVVGDVAGLPSVMAARDAALAGHLAASTLVTVPVLARPEWKMEIAVVAAR